MVSADGLRLKTKEISFSTAVRRGRPKAGARPFPIPCSSTKNLAATWARSRIHGGRSATMCCARRSPPTCFSLPPLPRRLWAGFTWSTSMKRAPCIALQYAFSLLAYDVVSETGLPSARELQRAPTDYPGDIRLVYLRLPDLNPKIADLARQVTSAATNNYDRATAIQNYLRDNFRYTLDPSAIEPKDPIDSFLFKSKSGYCEYFAASMAVMLRTLNIPSRLVNGFQTGSYNRIGKDFVVRARDAHSWVEVYFPNYGWITFDPTPADPNPIRAGAWDDYVDALNLFWSEWIVNYDFSHQDSAGAAGGTNLQKFPAGIHEPY